MMAKPIVDMIPIVRSVDCLDEMETVVRSLGYKWFGEYGLRGRRYCYRLDQETGKRLFQLHCYQLGHEEVPRHFALRDYLRAHPAIAKEYEVEKIRAAAIRPDAVNAYNDEKGAWIKRVEKDALNWSAQR